MSFIPRYNYRPSQGPWWSTRRMHSWSAHPQQNKDCRRCGDSHGLNQVCKALSRLCYICRRYGHYARFCQTSLLLKQRNHTSRSMDENTVGDNQNSMVLEKQKNTTCRRNQNNGNVDILKKAMCSVLPFHGLCDSDLAKMKSTSPYVQQNTMKHKQGNVSDKQVASLKEENESLKQTVTQLSQDNVTLQTSVAALEKMFLAAKTDIETLATRYCDGVLEVVERSLDGASEYRKMTYYCNFCGTSIYHRACQAAGHVCSLCDNMGHYSVFCPIIEKT